MEKRVLCLDCDGVIFNTVNMLKELIANINYCCSEEFNIKAIERAYQDNNPALGHMYTQIQFITRDEVLEELKPIYKKRICYGDIYVYENTYPGVVDTINKIIETGYFDKVYITTHVNTIEEALAKEQFFSYYLPGVELFTIQFKDTPYDYDDYFKNADRQRTNKALEFFKYSTVLPQEALFIDDSESICKEARELGAHAFYCNNSSDGSLAILTGMLEEIKKESNVKTKTI